MNKLEKPKFFNGNSFVNIIGIVGFIISIIQFLIPEKILSIQYKIFIFIAVFIFCFAIYLIQYVVKWHVFFKDCKNLENKFNELENRYNKRVEELNNKDNLLKEYEYFMIYLQQFITSSLTQNSSAETEQLKNMQNFLYLSAEHLSKLKGGNING